MFYRGRYADALLHTHTPKRVSLCPHRTGSKTCVRSTDQSIFAISPAKTDVAIAMPVRGRQTREGPMNCVLDRVQTGAGLMLKKQATNDK